jgi:hypothetical protein
MTDSMRTYKQFYKHTGTGEIYAVERSWDGHIVSSFGPIEDEPKGPDDYGQSAKAWLVQG